MNSSPQQERKARLGVALRRGLAVLCALWPLAILETAVELAGIAPPPSKTLEVWHTNAARQLDEAGGAFEPHDEWIWGPRPGALYQGESINEEGYRGPVLPFERSELPRIVTLGDSSTFGFAVKDEECFTRRLEHEFAAMGRPVETLNLGCVGHSAVQALRIYLGKARDYRPDLVIVAVGAVNEHFLVPPDESDLSKVRALKERGGKMLRWARRFSSVRWIEARVRGRDADGPTPTDATPLVSVKNAARVSVPEFVSALDQLADSVLADGAALLVVIPPKRGDADVGNPALVPYTVALREFVARRKLPTLDALARFRALDDADPVVRENSVLSPRFGDAYHPTVLGHQLYAKMLVEEIVRVGLLDHPRSGRNP